ncbi:MAG: MlaD family protein [bacterium]
MQITSGQKRRVGIFFIIGVVSVLGFAAVLIMDEVMKRRDCYYSEFEDVSIAGLSEGSSVKFQGMNIGSIANISIDPNNTKIVRVDFCIKPDIPLREGTVAELGNIGITGLKFMELQGGGDGPVIDTGEAIPSKPSSWDAITGKATVIAAKVEEILNNIYNITEGVSSEEIEKVIANVERISESVDLILRENRGEIKSVLKNSDVLIVNMNRGVEKITEVSNNLSRMTRKDGELDRAIADISETASKINDSYEREKFEESVEKINHLVESVQKTVDTVNLTLMRSQEDITVSFEELSEGMYNFNEFTRQIRENPATIFRGKGDDFE